MLQDAFHRGVQDAFGKFGLALPPPSTKALTPGHGLPAPTKLPAAPLQQPSPVSPLGKVAGALERLLATERALGTEGARSFYAWQEGRGAMAPSAPAPARPAPQSMMSPSVHIDPTYHAQLQRAGLGVAAAKHAANVGMGYSGSSAGGTGAVPGEPADTGRRQRSVVDRTFQQNDDFFASSSMPLPGANVSP